MKNTKETIVLMLCLSLIFSPSAVFAAPQGGKVVGGSANIHQSGATTTINQSSDRAVINWHSFDIGKNEAVRHNMPSRNSAGLHRVVGGGGASQIQGLLQSNGNVYLVNPAGVVIHKGARVDTNSFIATTRDIADSNFMKGHMAFDKPGRPDAQIINQGTISVKESGLAALVAPTVRNEGLIAGKLGKVALASGDATWKLDMHGDDLITFTVDENDVNALHAADGTPLAGVENSGSIKAEGGVVVLTAAQLDGIVGSVVNSGEASAASVELKGGKITFRGEGSDVDIVNTGTVDVSSAVADGGMVRMDTDGKTRSSGTIAATGGQKGGKVTLTGREVALSSTSKIDVSGNTGGGTALVGGNALGKGPERNAQKAAVERGASIHADAKVKGDGGQVVVWSDEKTTFDGTITAKGGSEGGNGGQVETSGNSLKVGDNARVETLAPRGLYGQWLLDPVDFVIAASGGDMTGAQLSSNLASSNVEIKSSDGKVNGNGDIFVNDAVSWAANTTLALTADRNVNVNANITATGANAGLTITPQNGAFDLQGGKITLSGANPSLNIAGQKYTVINSIHALQDIDNNLSGYYALGSDINASETRYWNNGKGFDPIGYRTEFITDANGAFCGALYGLGHTIHELTINRPEDDQIGFFVKLSNDAKIYDFTLNNIFIQGRNHVGSLASQALESVLIKNIHINGNSGCDPNIGLGNVQGEMIGGLVGSNNGDIINCSFSGNVTGGKYGVGGIAGINSGQIANSYSKANIIGHDGKYNSSHIGGLVGINSNGIIKNSYSQSSVIGNSYVGGLIGYMNNGTIYNSYSSGFVSAQEHVGGFIGGTKKGPMYSVTFDDEINDVINCYWDINSSGQNQGLGFDWHAEVAESRKGTSTETWSLTGLTSSQLKSQSSFIGWDFNGVWAIEERRGYPYLRTAATNIPRFEFNISNSRPEQSLKSLEREYLASMDRLHATLLNDLTKNTLLDLGFVSTLELGNFIKDTVSAKDLFSAIYNFINAFKLKDRIEKSSSWQLAYGKSELSALLLDHAYEYLNFYKENKNNKNIQTGELIMLLQNAEELLTVADAMVNSNITFDLILNEAYDRIIDELKSDLDKHLTQSIDIDIYSISKNQNINKILHTADYWGARTKPFELITKETIIDYKNSKDIVTKFSEKIVKISTSKASAQLDKKYSSNEIIDIFLDSESIYEIHNAISDKYSSYAISNNISGYDPSKIIGLEYVKNAYLSKYGSTEGGGGGGMGSR